MTTIQPPANPTSVSRVPILANPYSGKGPNRRRVDALIEALERRGLEPHPVWDRLDRAALLADPALADDCRCVVAAGGDGSCADVINEMSTHPAAATVPFATLPMGNENLFARQFGFHGPVERIADAIVRGGSKTIDVGSVTGAPQAGLGARLFTLMVSAGFDADVVHRLDRWRKEGEHLRRVNRLSYVPKIMGAIRRYDYPTVTLQADGAEPVTGAHVFVFNIPQYGGPLDIGRHADETDALLDWIVFTRPGLVNLADYGLSVLSMRHLGRPDVPHGRARSLRITAETPVPLQADGDPIGFTPATIEVRPGAVRVMQVRPSD